MKYIIGTRGSNLALVQANYVCDRLNQAYPEHEFDIKVIKTKGDKILDKPLNAIGDKGLFVKEIEEQILDGTVDMGVHSMKDMPSTPAPGLVFTKSWKREDNRDVLILREAKSLDELPSGAVIGTGSMRRELELKKNRPDLVITGIRGNVETRLRKMKEENMDGIVLAAAGLKRLGKEDIITQYLSYDQMMPAPAQGVLALEIREEDNELQDMLDKLWDEKTNQCAMAERDFLEAMGADCHTPVGAACTSNEDDSFTLQTMYGRRDGSQADYEKVTGTSPVKLAKEAAELTKKKVSGVVTLVGAGPGDPGLLTIQGMNAIKEADCIIYDRLSSPELLDYCKPDCEKIYVGKANRHHTMKQDDINALLVNKAVSYNHVVRLKGGDCYVFGRGGEEGIYLRDHYVSFEVIPGVSSALAGLAYAGIPITHRGVATGFTVVTAHNKQDELADIDFEAMARGNNTCVFLMGLSKVGEITRKLMEAGMANDMPAAVISAATTNAQRTVTASLQELEKEVEKAKLPSPALIVVGKVVSLREQLEYFEHQPLFGLSYLVPKIGKNVSNLTKKLRKQGAMVKEITLGDIVPKEIVLTKEKISRADWLIFTSKNGVKCFFDAMTRNHIDMRAFGHIKVAAVGSATENQLIKRGIYPDIMPQGFTGSELATQLKKVLHETDWVWHVRPEVCDTAIKDELKDLCQFKECVMYTNEEVMPDGALTLDELYGYDGIVFTSASMASRFFERAYRSFAKLNTSKLTIYSIGPKTSEQLEYMGVQKVHQSSKATYDGLVSYLCQEN